MTDQKIRVLINGAVGKMGRSMSAGILATDDLSLVAAVDIKGIGSDVGLLSGLEASGLTVTEDLAQTIRQTQPQVMVDFTNPQAILKNLRLALAAGIACVVGTSGLGEHELNEVAALVKAHQAPVFVAPNFALGAVLMMRFAQEAAHYFPHLEIIERHHDQKLDAPSGTAIATLEMVAQVRKALAQGAAHEFEKISGSRGGDFQGARVHSIRLPGYIATQEVIFGAPGQTLTIRHDSIDRDCFLPGLLLAIRKVRSLSGLVVGLEQIID